MQKIVPGNWTRALNASHLIALDQESTVLILNTAKHVILLAVHNSIRHDVLPI